MKYTVIAISDTRSKNVANIKKVMGDDNEFVNGIEFVDGRSIDAFKMLNDFGVRTDVYAPDDGRSDPMRDSEAGCWMSHIRAIDFIVQNDLPELLVFEDDASITKNFISFLDSCVNDLPSDYDFLSLYSEQGQNSFSPESDIGSKFIHKAITQKSMNVAMLYSNKGAHNILKVARRSGATYNIDSIIYRASINGFLKGFVVRPDKKNMVSHGKYASIIDPENFRNT